MTHSPFIQIRAVGPVISEGAGKNLFVMEVVVSESRVQFRKNFFGRDEGNRNDRPFAMRGRRKLADQPNTIALATTREWKNFIDFLADTRGVEKPGWCDDAFYAPDKATWEREVAQAA